MIEPIIFFFVGIAVGLLIDCLLHRHQERQ